MTNKTKPLTIVVCCDRMGHEARAAVQQTIVDALGAMKAVSVRVLPHLYDMVVDGPAAECLRGIKGDLMVLAWLYPRASYWILDSHGVRGKPGHSTFFPDDELDAKPRRTADDPNRTLWCLDLRPHREPAKLIAEIERIAAERVSDGAGEHVPYADAASPQEATQPRWYPVVDRNRCQTCMECLNFCLFGVFGIDTAGELFVEQPDACRNGCPACARVCPAGAIMFPEHDNAMIAGDSHAPAADLNSELVQLFGPHPAADIARTERAHAPRKPTSPRTTEKAKVDLDALVDELDREPS